MSDLEVPVCTGSTSMHNTFWNTLTIEVAELIQECEVLNKEWTTRTSSQAVSVVINGSAH
jgi:hypothetical protein